jgi:hypothetical protein
MPWISELAQLPIPAIAMRMPQRQESRRSKARQGTPQHPEFGMDEVPIWWRRAAARNAPFPLDATQLTALGLA